MSISTDMYDGKPVFTPGTGMTAFGFYDNDAAFGADAPKAARFIGTRLGWPLMDVELTSGSMFTALEEAVTTYGNTVYAWKVKENYLSLEGGSTKVAANDVVVEPTLQRVIEIAKNYGTEADVGGNVTLHHGLLEVKAGVQCYDLDLWAKNQGIEGGIEIRKVYYEAPPAILRYFDPYAGTGTGLQSLMDTFDFGSYSPGVNFLLMPVSYDLLKVQAIEFNDQVRKSAYSFRLSNNQLELFPIPVQGGVLRLEYYKLSDKRKLNTGASNYVATSVHGISGSWEIINSDTRLTTSDIEFISSSGYGTDFVVDEYGEYHYSGSNYGWFEVNLTSSYLNIESDVAKSVSVQCQLNTVIDGMPGNYMFLPNQLLVHTGSVSGYNVVDKLYLKLYQSIDTGSVVISYPTYRTSVDGVTNFSGYSVDFTVEVENAPVTRKFIHTLNTTNVSVQVYEDKANGVSSQMLPAQINIVNAYEIDITFAQTTTGHVVFSGTAEESVLDSEIITNVSEVPYENPTYSKINSIGRQWIFRYALAICKETLAYIRGKYTTLKVPNSETTLNQSDLLTDARTEKKDLLQELTDILSVSSRQSQLELKAKEAESLKTVLTAVPVGLYIG